ncbi:MAG TPA: FAD-dependent oxidoreductase [Pyrinomonadaceae bacterium]|jgi:glycine/D-amino acid oxidase-like deaminating enzyme|nr:FAD-dependent oxidoreductase [Pyrinomonadaceae bacterium]
MSSKAYDVVIIGAGIVGSACAAECAREGLSVAIVEAGIIGGGATAAGMGHLVVMDDSEAQFALTRYSQQLWDDIADELPREVEHDACGTIWIAADDDEMAEARRKARVYSDRGVAVEILDAHSLAEAEPQLRPGLAGGLRVPGDSVIYPPCAAQFFVDQALARGAELFLGAFVETIMGDGIRLRDGTSIAAGVIVNSAGSWSPQLTTGLEVKKRKGHLVITDRYPNFLRHQLVELGYLKSAHSVTADSVAFNIQPRKTGQLLIGSSRQYDVDDSHVDVSILTRMLDRAVEYLPGLRKLSSLRTWTGFRAATPDKLPLIGPHAEHQRLYLATGHEGLGITTSLGTAKLLVAQIMNRETAIPVAPYLPERVTQEPAHA